MLRVANCSKCGPVKVRVLKKKGCPPQIACDIKRREQRKKDKAKARKKRHCPYRLNIDLSKCVKCGFVAEDKCQIDVDHINSKHNDDRPENLQALCANCHRLKTKEERLEKSRIRREALKVT